MASLSDYFEAYGRAFAAYDAATVAAYYAVPSLLAQGGETVALGTPEAVVESVEKLLDIHRAWNVQTAAVEAAELVETAPAHLVARVDWRLGRKKSRVQWRFSTTYVLVPHADAWRIAAALTHDSPF